MREHFTSEQIIAGLKATNGLVSLAAKRVGCSVPTIYSRAKKVKAIHDAIWECRDELIDIAELALRSCLTKQEPWAIALVLKTLGKERGYVERQEVTGADGEPFIPIITVLVHAPAEADSE